MKFKCDKQDIPLIMFYKWRIDQNGYVGTDWGGSRIYLHRFLMNFPNTIVDHINRNKLDNRRINLRLSNKSNNAVNCKTHSHNTSGYKGVSKSGNRWRVYIVKNQKQIHIGCFKTKKLAALAYNQKALEIFKSHANLNKVK
jgi:HNH endonuclease